MKKKSRLILALDVSSKEQALSIAEEVGDIVDAIKIGYPLALGSGMGVIGEIAGYCPVICDFKIADIDNTSRLIVQEAVKSGASGVICHGFVGEDSLRACIKAAEGRDVFVVAEMSHPGSERFILPVSEDLARLAVAVGATGIVAPGTRPDRIKTLRKIVGDLVIISPGIGAQGGSAGMAIIAGADYVIAGRSIYNSNEPRKSAENIVKEIEQSM